MAEKSRKASISRAEQRELLKLSPFELKDKLISLAAESEQRERRPDAQRRARQPELDLHHAARRLRHAASLRSRGVAARRQHPDAGRNAQKDGMAKRFATFLERESKRLPAPSCSATLGTTGVKTLKFDADTFAYELAEGIIG